MSSAKTLAWWSAMGPIYSAARCFWRSRLVESGVPVVQASMGIVQTWDTHVANFPRLRDSLLPPLDQAVSALLDDLSVRGLLDETLVVMLGEFGRTPKISRLTPDAVPGRDHWPAVFPAVFAGAGVRGGQLIGKSDRLGAHPISRSFGPTGPGGDDLSCPGGGPRNGAARSIRPPATALFGAGDRVALHGGAGLKRAQSADSRRIRADPKCLRPRDLALDLLAAGRHQAGIARRPRRAGKVCMSWRVLP